MQLGLEGKVVFITASSDGIGKAAAVCFLEEGASAVINGRDKEKLERCVVELQKRFGSDRVQGIQGDMSVIEAVRGAGEYLRERWGSIDILV